MWRRVFVRSVIALHDRVNDRVDRLGRSRDRKKCRLATVLSLPLFPKRLPVTELVLVGEEIGPVLGFLVDADETPVVVFKARISRPEQLDADVYTSAIEGFRFAVFTEKSLFVFYSAA